MVPGRSFHLRCGSKPASVREATVPPHAAALGPAFWCKKSQLSTYPPVARAIARQPPEAPRHLQCPRFPFARALHFPRCGSRLAATLEWLRCLGVHERDARSLPGQIHAYLQKSSTRGQPPESNRPERRRDRTAGLRTGLSSSEVVAAEGNYAPSSTSSTKHHIQFSPDSTHGVQAEAGAFANAFGGKEWIEDSGANFLRYARTVVSDCDNRAI